MNLKTLATCIIIGNCGTNLNTSIEKETHVRSSSNQTRPYYFPSSSAFFSDLSLIRWTLSFSLSFSSLLRLSCSFSSFLYRSQPKSSIPFLWTLSTFGVILARTSNTEARVRAMLGAPRSGMWSDCWNKKKEHVSLIISVNTNSLLMCLKAEEFVWVQREVLMV